MAARRRKSRKAVRRPRPKPKPRPRARRKPARRAKPARAKRKPAARARAAKPVKRAPAAALAERTPTAPHRLVTGAPIEVGVVLHYYPRAAAAVVALSRPIHRGDTIHVRGQTTDFVQPVSELALDGAAVSDGAPPQEIGVRFEQRARAGDRVYRISW